MKKFLMLTIAAVMSVMFLGCGKVSVQNYNNMSVEDVANRATSTAEIEKAIIRAGSGLGWVMKKMNDGNIQGTLVLRKHEAVVAIKYNSREYSINYVESKNLDYDPGENTIHQNYNGWVQNLNKAIRVQLSSL